ncbi:FAD binding domain-containing protein [Bacillus sp. FJAT-28004]|uniref:FAD binding domain-containing protein n=1 Tax=Bacillus sp. FJAT-28004 TaxID=1679165 RepID=UPI0006B493A4|nr:FAD binding domain-containing protein [Bacillus sp. FJAT-28004]
MSMNVQEIILTPLVWHPQSAAEAWLLKQSYGLEGVYISGGTLLRTQWESGISAVPKHLIDLSAIRGLNEVKIGESDVIIGGQVSLQACRTNAFLRRNFPLFTDALRVIAAPSIRHLATVGGNVSSMIGDSIPALLAYDAEVIWYNGLIEQQVPLSDYLLLTNDPNQGNERLLLSIILPFTKLMEESSVCKDEEDSAISKIKRFGAYHKVGRREAFTPSIVTAAINGAISPTGVLTELRIALGGGQMVPQRLEPLEEEIVGTAVDNKLLQRVYDRILQVYEPREDLFATASYRKITAANVITAELWKAARD